MSVSVILLARWRDLYRIITSNPCPRSDAGSSPSSAPVFFELDLLGSRLRTLRHCRRTYFGGTGYSGYPPLASRWTRDRNTKHENHQGMCPLSHEDHLTLSIYPSLYMYRSIHLFFSLCSCIPIVFPDTLSLHSSMSAKIAPFLINSWTRTTLKASPSTKPKQPPRAPNGPHFHLSNGYLLSSDESWRWEIPLGCVVLERYVAHPVAKDA